MTDYLDKRRIFFEIIQNLCQFSSILYILESDYIGYFQAGGKEEHQ